jgi:two-component system KDP operon response regulator KdpE
VSDGNMRASGHDSVTILLVEDDPETRHHVAANLGAHGYLVQEAGDVRGALERWKIARPDLILLDLGLPDRDGLSVVRHVRAEATTPILILSARGDERVKVAALEQGADDYVTKPFGLDELRARISALLRRASGSAGDATGRMTLGPVTLDAAHHHVTVNANALELTPREFELLRVLLQNAGRVVTRARLLRAVWGRAYSDEPHYLHVYVSRLRRKLTMADPTGRAAALIVAEPGVGYRVAGPAEVARVEGSLSG